MSDYKQVAEDLAGALDEALLQISQVRGLFGASDETLTAAVEDGVKALEDYGRIRRQEAAPLSVEITAPQSFDGEAPTRSEAV
jgi:hypothetical protein